LGYAAFDEAQASQSETDDLANRLRNYRDVTRFVGYETELLAGCAYRDHPLPEHADLKAVRRTQACVADKLARPQAYIDSDVKLRTELIGPPVAQPGDAETIWGLIREYTAIYAAWHDTVLDRLEDQCKRIDAVLNGDELHALGILEGISALQPAVTDGLRAGLVDLQRGIFACPSASRASIQDQLHRGPIHECGLTFANGQVYLDAARGAADEAGRRMDTAVMGKMQVFHNPAIRERMAQGASEPTIAALLACDTAAETRAYLIGACLADPTAGAGAPAGIVGLINRYLRRIVVKRVPLTAFHPSSTTIERGQVAAIVQEFRHFLEERLAEIETDPDGDTLPVLQIE
jgi:hypothetical protein